ncbi:hypothetical protein COU58_00190 [Candidatus Pacearchaeota archaeon CG10_big_fil_rev_8_21_14_0_10_32_42]|nr:MAG: hypothetical protein COU58_00190 [Candidatus Pacearchaeota archaeon CG10_big_fil_rev_8_21_14_0_10_32_42]
MEYLDFFTDPYVFAAGSEVVDNLGTCYNCSINGIDQEGNPDLKKDMEEKGILKGCLYKLPSHTLLMVGVTGVAAGLDYLLGIDQSDINFTKGWAYGLGGFKYLNGVGHIVIGTVSSVELGLEWLLKKIN